MSNAPLPPAEHQASPIERLGPAIERRDGRDFPFYNGIPTTITARQWRTIVAAVVVGFGALILLPLSGPLTGFIPAILFTGFPLAALFYVARQNWTAIFRRVSGRDVGLMFFFAALNLGAPDHSAALRPRRRRRRHSSVPTRPSASSTTTIHSHAPRIPGSSVRTYVRSPPGTTTRKWDGSITVSCAPLSAIAGVPPSAPIQKSTVPAWSTTVPSNVSWPDGTQLSPTTLVATTCVSSWTIRKVSACSTPGGQV